MVNNFNLYAFIMGLFTGFITIILLCQANRIHDDNIKFQETIKDGYCILNDNVGYTIQHYYGSIDDNVICVDKNGVLHALREDLQVLV